MKKNLAKEIIEAVQILINNAMKKTTNINGGVITAISDNGMETDMVGILESLTQCVHRVHGLACRIERIDALVRRTAGMGGLTVEGEGLCHAAVGALDDVTGMGTHA